MDKREALHVAITAIFREILREDEPWQAAPAPFPQAEPPDENPYPRLDFDESNDLCEHGGVYFNRELCPVHGPSAQEDVTAEELDDITNETAGEANPLMARAQRAAALRAQREATKPLFPEDLPMSGLAGRPPEA